MVEGIWRSDYGNVGVHGGGNGDGNDNDKYYYYDYDKSWGDAAFSKPGGCRLTKPPP